MTPLRSAPERAAADQWALVLHSQGLDCRVEPDGAGWSLLVDSRDAERGEALLEVWDRENRRRERARARPPEYGPTAAGAAMALALLAFHLVAIAPAYGSRWHRLGSAASERILDGEWWRTVTALTLHADLAHVLANAAACALFATAVCRHFGPGVGWAAIVAAGALGNAVNAFAHGPGHVSVGASTAVFGALGLLAGERLWTRRRLGLRGTRAWAPLAAALALLAMLGTAGERTDLLAHVFGLGAGLVLGLGAAVALRRPPGEGAQRALLLAALAGVALCWGLALGHVAPP